MRHGQILSNKVVPHGIVEADEVSDAIERLHPDLPEMAGSQMPTRDLIRVDDGDVKTGEVRYFVVDAAGMGIPGAAATSGGADTVCPAQLDAVARKIIAAGPGGTVVISGAGISAGAGLPSRKEMWQEEALGYPSAQEVLPHPTPKHAAEKVRSCEVPRRKTLSVVRLFHS